ATAGVGAVAVQFKAPVPGRLRAGGAVEEVADRVGVAGPGALAYLQRRVAAGRAGVAGRGRRERRRGGAERRGVAVEPVDDGGEGVGGRDRGVGSADGFALEGLLVRAVGQIRRIAGVVPE